MTRSLVNAHLPGTPFLLEGDRRAGAPDGVLLVHGLTATTAEVRPLAEYLHGQGFTVAGLLLPGHGTDPRDIGRYRWQDWLAAVTQAYNELKARCRRVAVGGESTGSVLTLHLAATHPEIAGVMAYAPALKLTLTPTQLLLTRALAPFDVMPTPKHGPPAESDALWQGYDVRPLRGVRELLRLQAVVRPMLPRIRQPILIVQGRLDRSVDPGVPQEIYDRVGSADKELHWFSKSAHCVAIDCERQQLAELTHTFLTRACKTGGEA